MEVRRAVVGAGLAAALVLCVLVASPVLAATPSPSPSPDSCAGFPDDSAGFMARIGCQAGQRASQAVGSAAGQLGQAAASAAEGDFTRWLASGAVWVIQRVTEQVAGTSTTPQLDPSRATEFTAVYGRVVGVALSLSVLLVLIGIIEATLTQRPGGMRRMVVGIAVGGIGVGAIPAGTAVLVRIIDDLSTYIANGESGHVQQSLIVLGQVFQKTDPVEGGAAIALAALGVLIGGTLLWLELMVRASLIYVFVGVAPLACAAVQWPRLEGVLRQVLFGGLALILSKLVIAVVLAVGFGVLQTTADLQGLMSGMFILAIAALMPFSTARVLSLAAEELSQTHQGRLRGWAIAGAGWGTGRLIAAAAMRGGAPPMPVGPAIAGAGPRASGTGLSGPSAAGGRGGSSGGPGRAGPGRPGSGRTPPGPIPRGPGGGSRGAGGTPAGGATGSPGSPTRPSGPATPAARPPRPGPRGPAPPVDGGPPPVRG